MSKNSVRKSILVVITLVISVIIIFSSFALAFWAAAVLLGATNEISVNILLTFLLGEILARVVLHYVERGLKKFAAYLKKLHSKMR